jgi:hypothetical protein
MRNVIFAAVLATSALLATGATSHAHAASAAPAAVTQAEPTNPLVEQVYWVRYYYRTYTYVRTCGWVATIYGPVRVCN